MTSELKKLKCGKVIENVSLEKYTSYKLKEKKKNIVIVNNINDLKKLLDYLKTNKIKHKIIGGGTNLIFDGDYDGVLIKLDVTNLLIDGRTIKVEAGCNLINVALNFPARKG